jgi:nucleoside-diphosphate-sugar epimerase
LNPNRKILVTGADGFIGQSLIPLLLENGFSIRATARAITKLNDKSFPGPVEWVEYDLTDAAADFTSLLKGVNAVIHLAGKAHDLAGKGDITNDYQRINIDGTESLARASAENRVERFIFISTAKAYEDNLCFKNNDEIQKVTEDDTPSPQDNYAQSKLKAEHAIYNVCGQSNMSYVILRPPLVFGPHVKANFLHLMNTVQRGYPLPLAAINNLRSFIYVGNLCHAILDCLGKPEAANQLFLVSDTELSTPALIRKIAFSLGKKATIFYLPVPVLKMLGKLTGKYDQVSKLTASLVVDTTKIRQRLQWQPPFSLEEGLKATTDWYKTRLKNN